MFKQNFIKICTERGVAPTSVLKQIGLSNATFSCWNDDSIPRQTTLVKIADYFGITVEDLLRDPSEPQTAPAQATPETDPLLDEFAQLLDQLTVKELRELKAFMLEKINSRK